MAQSGPVQDATKPMTDGQQAEIIDLDALDALPDLMAPQTTAAQPSTADGGMQQSLPTRLPASDQQAPAALQVKQEEVKREATPKAEVKEESGAQVRLGIGRHLIHPMCVNIASRGPLQGGQTRVCVCGPAHMMASSTYRTLDAAAGHVLIFMTAQHVHWHTKIALDP